MARPFNFYVYPISKDAVRDCTTLRFQASAVEFLSKNNFDFNMLFGNAINYARKSDFESVYEKCVFKVGKYYPDSRICEALSTSNQAQLEDSMNKVKDWVYDPTSEKTLVLNITSMALRKNLDKRVKKEYMRSGMFLNWNRNSTEMTFEKSKRFD